MPTCRFMLSLCYWVIVLIKLAWFGGTHEITKMPKMTRRAFGQTPVEDLVLRVKFSNVSMPIRKFPLD